MRQTLAPSVCTLLLLAAFVAFLPKSVQCQPNFSIMTDSSETVMDYIMRNIHEFAPPEYFAARESLRVFQRRQYCEVLSYTMERDGLGALISYLKLKLQNEFAVVQRPFYFWDRNRTKWPLPFDWSYPVDPWKRE